MTAWADIDVAGRVEDEVSSGEEPLGLLSFAVEDRHVRLDPALPQPANKQARAVGCVTSESGGFEPEALLGALDHHRGGGHLGGAPRRGGRDIHHDRPLQIHEIVDPVGEGDLARALGGPG